MEYTTEEQQIEDIKKWWAENGIPIGLGIVIGLGGIFGYRAYDTHQIETAQAASGIYEQMISNARIGETEQAQTFAKQILSGYDSTSYAVFANLLLAKIAVDDGDLDTAREQLQQAHAKAPTRELQLLSQLRLARVELAADAPDKAMAILKQNEFDGFKSAVAELTGDIHVSKGDLSAAGASYRMALEASEPGSEQYQILEIKLDSVGRISSPS